MEEAAEKLRDCGDSAIGFRSYFSLTCALFIYHVHASFLLLLGFYCVERKISGYILDHNKWFY